MLKLYKDTIFQMRKRGCGFVALALWALMTTGCVDMANNQRVVMIPARTITFLLVDNSLSYNNPNDEGSQKVMALVEQDITAKILAAEPGDHFIVRTIQSESNQLSAMISNLNLAKDELYFLEPRPTNPIELKVWERDKRDFEAGLEAKTSAAKQAAIEEFQQSSKSIFAKPSNRTDFIGALLTCQRFFEKQNYDRKKLVIYSDMVEDAALEDESLLNLSGVEVVARFVTKPPSAAAGNTHQYFINLETRWRIKLNANKFELYEVQNSF